MRIGESKIGQKPIIVPKGVKITFEKAPRRGYSLIKVQGPLGTNTQLIKSQVSIKESPTAPETTPAFSQLSLQHNKSAPDYDKDLLGTYRSVIQNMVYDSTIGYLRQLELVGIGFRAFFAAESKTTTGGGNKTTTGGGNSKKINNNELRLRIGTTHDVVFPVPPDILMRVHKEGTQVDVFGCDRRRVSEVAKKLRLLKRPEPYKGKGIRYKGEVVRLKTVRKKSGK